MTVMRVLLPLALLAMVAGCGSDTPPPVVATPSASSTTASATQPPASTATTAPPAASPSSAANDDGFLAALRAGGVPVSATGEPERLIGHGVCQQLYAGASPDKLAHDLTASGYTLAQAATVVAAAQGNYCG